jgi:hypothetical protein
MYCYALYGTVITYHSVFQTAVLNVIGTGAAGFFKLWFFNFLCFNSVSLLVPQRESVADTAESDFGASGLKSSRETIPLN